MADRGTGGTTNDAREYAKKPKYSRFSQQELPAFKPILTPGWVITAFIAIGMASLFASQQVVEILDRYDSDCVPTT